MGFVEVLGGLGVSWVVWMLYSCLCWGGGEENYLARAVDFKGEHACCFCKVVGVVERDAEVVGFCRGFVGRDVRCEGVVGGLPVIVFVWDKVAGCEEVEVIHFEGATG